MTTKWRLVLFVGLLLLTVSSGLLSACNVFTGGSAETDSRITVLENQLKTQGDSIAKLQQQVQEQQSKIDALTPSSATPATPAAPVTPPPITITTTTPTPAPVALRRVTYGNLTITPAEAKLGQTITMSIEVTNPGDVEGTFKVVLIEKAILQVTSSDLIEYASVETFKAGETRTVTFTTSKSALGTYQVLVGDKVGQYSVVETTS